MSQPPNPLLNLSSPETEQAVLGSILIDASALFSIMWLKPDDFYLERHQIIFDAMRSLYDESRPIDFLSLNEILEQRGCLNDIGGSAYIVSLYNAVPTAMQAGYHARRLQGLAIKRRQFNVLNEMAGLITGEQSAEELFTIGMQKWMATAPQASRSARPMQEVITDALIEFRLRADEPIEIIGAPSGFDNLDAMLGGFRPGLHIWCGAAGMGKTTLLLNVWRKSTLKRLQRSALFTLEMSERQLAHRLMAMESGQGTRLIETGLVNGLKLKTQEIQDVENGAERLLDAESWVVYAGGQTSGEIRAQITELKAKHDIQIAYIDHLQLLADRGDNRNAVLGKATRSFFDSARELGIPIVALSQLSRGIEHRETHIPMLSDLRDSGEIEQDADVVLAIVDEDYYHRFELGYERKHVVYVPCLKDRLGSAAGRSCKFIANERTTALEPAISGAT